jgi:glycosyltransferase involved in cell wall biosynthesis
MKLIIQIPCYNEEKTLPVALAELPRELPGFDAVEWLIIDDGSTDRTIEVARQSGVDHVVTLPKHQGLAKGFMAGIEACLSHGADVILNTDADNQYCSLDIPLLVTPILQGKAQIVIGARPIAEITHFSSLKKRFQKLGSKVVRMASNTDIPDTTSGFRAISREAAMQMNVFNNYTYTLETIIQAGQKNLSVISVPVRVNEDLRPSRLLKSITSYIKHSIITIIRVFVVYKPFRFFFTLGSGLLTIGVLIGIRYLFFFFNGQGNGHLQSLILASITIIMGFQTFLVAFLADLLAANRRLNEDIQYRIRKFSLTQQENNHGRSRK